MKKFLLSAAAIMAAMTMNAQEVCTFNAENVLGLDADNGTALTAGTVIGETASIVATIGADDTYKPQSVKATAGDTEIDGGLQGATNPKDEDGTSSNTTLKVPVSGAFLQFEAKADGFLYVIHKASSNKAYTVFEEGEAIGYTFAAIGNKDPLPEVYEFTLTGAGEYNWLKEAGITSVEFAEQEYLKATDKAAYDARWAAQDDGTTKWTNISAGGIGVIKFPVFADCKYVVNASGSKITAGGFVFSTEDNVTIKSGDVTIIGEGGTTPVVEEKVYSVIGTLNGNWDTDDDMIKGEDGIYTFVFENVAAGEYKFKVRQNHDWNINWGGGDDADGNTVFTVENDGSTVTITFNPATEELKYEVSGGAIEPAGEVLKVAGAEGAMEYAGTWAGNWWNLNETMDLDVSSYDYLWIDYDGFEGAIQFGIFYSEWQKTESWGEVWYTDQVDLTDAAGIVGIPVEKTKIIEKGVGGVDSEFKGDVYAKHARQVFTQDKGKASKINIKGIYLGTKEQYEAALAGASAINAVKAAAQDSDAIYNIAGQKVSASYKGLVIKNGKKYIQK